ncbi:hypothetical protein IE077_000635 [Cardiosporidium cionae]|uniref:Choline transporter-like protein n=1 Tax=Cardiosporidium cionae TaxID=476202 RepID=A0ABQ7J771_9APIC|nr:hypothetical protein IE077_000635 [Cardiosporidium cionae]|eukprot:KAF8819830.1 hypothetical protein IE077_000635 [Cardiosporidium cionae]
MASSYSMIPDTSQMVYSNPSDPRNGERISGPSADSMYHPPMQVQIPSIISEEKFCNQNISWLSAIVAAPSMISPYSPSSPHTLNSLPANIPMGYAPAAWTASNADANSSMLPTSRDNQHLHRKVTNRNIAIYFMIFLGILIGGTLFVAIPRSNISRLYKGINYQGKVCGKDASVRRLPYLFYPLDPRSSPDGPSLLRIHSPLEQLSSTASYSLNSFSPYCISSCPSKKESKAGQTIPISFVDTSQSKDRSSAIVTEYKVHSPLYPTERVANSLCLPTDPALRAKVGVALKQQSSHFHRWAVGSLLVAWPLFITTLLLTTLFSCLYLALCNFLPMLTFPVTALYSLFLFFFSGCYLIYGGYTEMLDPVKRLIYSQDHIISFLFGIVLLIVTGAGTIILLISHKSLTIATRMINCVGEFLSDVPSILITPFITTGVLFFWLIVWSVGYLHSISAGSAYSINVPLNLQDNGDISILPLYRSFSWDFFSVLLSILWWLALLLVFECILSFCQFVLAYFGTIWYFSPSINSHHRDVGWNPSIIAMIMAVRHHLGSFVIGAIIMAFTRPIRFLFPWISKRQPLFVYYSPLLERIKAFLGQWILPINVIVDRFSSAGYVEMTLSSSSFFTSMDASSEKLLHSHSPAASLHGIMQLPAVLGTVAISLTVGLINYSTLLHVDAYSALSSHRFVCAPFFIAFAADTLLYCFLIEAIKRPVIDENPLTKVHAPPSLKQIILDLQNDPQIHPFFFQRGMEIA